ncbi:hypothetical protein [Paenibacillus aestuarii]|uniref:ABC transporter substrate-binding protein n=1 Tax=Paenibacillus aestuarii TaxID=516965 RepID=A0ABW0K303_9BACL|nr:hypothetical protein [Paenibacillus aestuarii]
MKKSLIGIAAILSAVLLLSACGGQAGNTGTNKAGAAASPAASAGAASNVDTTSKELTVYTALEDDQIKAVCELGALRCL